MLKLWAILIGLSAALVLGTPAIAGGDDCASKQNRADNAAPAAEKSAAQSQSTTTEKSKPDLTTN
jgi:hypothetical protein